MKYAIFAVLLTGALAVAGNASAQQTVRANERYCLESLSKGPNPLLCRFETYAQCVASKTAPKDGCLLNPQLAFQ